MVYPLIESPATKFSLSKEELVQQNIKAFLLNQLHLHEVKRRKIFKHHDVQTYDEFDHLLINNPDEEGNLLENFQRAEYLTQRIEEISQWIKEYNAISQ